METQDLIHKGIEFSQQERFKLSGNDYRSGVGFGYSCGLQDGLNEAKQEAIGFAEWISIQKNYHFKESSTGWFWYVGGHSIRYTSDDLYNIYNQQKQK